MPPGWLTEAGLPREGVLYLTYTATAINVPLRKALYAMVSAAIDFQLYFCSGSGSGPLCCFMPW